MGDPRYQAHIPDRDRMHDMPNVAMYMTQEEGTAVTPPPGHVLLVGAIAMNEGFGFDDHAKYEEDIAEISGRHGMKLVRSFRVLNTIGAGPTNVAAVNVWSLPSPDALGQVMGDPEYVGNIPNRDRIHDMASTSMYFVAPRGQNQ